MAPNQAQEVLVLHVGPVFAHPQEDVAAVDVDRSVEDTSGMAPADRDAHLLADASGAEVQRWCFREDGFIQHQQPRARPLRQPGF
jgi:hypothetical protein